MSRTHTLQRRSSRGLSLIEVMVALAIGLVVIGAVFANYLNNSQGSRQTAAMTQVGNDAALAFGILRNHIAMADYSEPIGVTTTGMTKRMTGMAVFGCEGRFNAATDDEKDLSLVTCATASTIPTTAADALLIRFQADADSTHTVTPTGGGAAAPSGCSGNALSVDTGTGIFVADSRFQISANNELTCMSVNGDSPANEPLVENIANMQLTYGVANTDTDGRPFQIIRYVSASDVAPATATAPQIEELWGRVLSVRICLLVRSAEEVLNAVTPYRGCNPTNIITPTDRRIYRAFTSTVVLNNRMNGNPNAIAAPPPPPTTPPPGGDGGAGGTTTPTPTTSP